MEYNSNPELYRDLVWLSIYYKEQHEAAFLYGWMLIETYLKEIWDGHIESFKNRTKADKDALKDHRSWTGYYHIEMLSYIMNIKPEVRSLFHALRKKGNKVAHEKTICSLEGIL
jgi:hypothetical protein